MHLHCVIIYIFFKTLINTDWTDLKLNYGWFFLVVSSALVAKPLRLHHAAELDKWTLCVKFSSLKIRSDLFISELRHVKLVAAAPPPKRCWLHALDLSAVASPPDERVTSIQLYGAIYHCVAYQQWIRAAGNEGATCSHCSLSGSIRPPTSSGFTRSATQRLNHTLIEFKCADREAPL